MASSISQGESLFFFFFFFFRNENNELNDTIIILSAACERKSKMLRLETQHDTFISANGHYAEAEADTSYLGNHERYPKSACGMLKGIKNAPFRHPT